MSVIFARDSAAVRNSEVSAWLEAPPYDTQTPIRTTKNSLIFSDLFDEGVAVESLLYFRNSRFPSIESNFNSTLDYREDLSRQRHPVLYREAPPRYPATPFLLYSNFLQKPFPFHILQLKKSSTLLYTQSLKRMPLSGGASLLHSSKIERKADREKVARKTRWGWGDTK